MTDDKQTVGFDTKAIDLLAGKAIQTDYGTFWFNKVDVNNVEGGLPKHHLLHRENGPAVVWKTKYTSNKWPKTEYWLNGVYQANKGKR